MGNHEKSELVITDVFKKGSHTRIAEKNLDTMLDLMDSAAEAADEQLGLVSKPIEVEVEIIP
jgi:hypothetical protein